ncbi:MAG: hypothetical protein MJ141_03440, partial [Clostridia bacterium]|nr:hypothetical protein [Clostridia bacterium]
VGKRLPGFPIVLHGASSVPQEFVKTVNQFGGKMPDAIGIPEEKASSSLRISLGRENTEEDARYMAKILPEIIENIRRLS